MQSALEKRAKLDIYPFKKGFKQAKDWKKYQDGNITSVRLCFEVLYKVTRFLKQRNLLDFFCKFHTHANGASNTMSLWNSTSLCNNNISL